MKPQFVKTCMEYAVVRNRQVAGIEDFDFPKELKDHHVKWAETQFQADYRREHGVDAPPRPVGRAPYPVDTENNANSFVSNDTVTAKKTTGRGRGSYRSKSVRLSEQEDARRAEEEAARVAEGKAARQPEKKSLREAQKKTARVAEETAASKITQGKSARQTQKEAKKRQAGEEAQGQSETGAEDYGEQYFCIPDLLLTLLSLSLIRCTWRSIERCGI